MKSKRDIDLLEETAVSTSVMFCLEILCCMDIALDPPTLGFVNNGSVV